MKAQKEINGQKEKKKAKKGKKDQKGKKREKGHHKQIGQSLMDERIVRPSMNGGTQYPCFLYR